MKKKIKVDDLKIGMQFIGPIWFGVNIIHPANVVLKTSDLERIKRTRVNEVEIEMPDEEPKQEKSVESVPAVEPPQSQPPQRQSGSPLDALTAPPVGRQADQSKSEAPKPEKPLDRREALIAKLKEYRSTILDLEKKEIDNKKSDASKSTPFGNLDVIKKYTDLLERTRNTFLDIKMDKIAIKNDIYDVVNALIDLVMNNRSDLFNVISNVEDKAFDYLTVHPVNVAIYSIAIGYQLNLGGHKLIQLGIAALLHDVGMLKIPEELTRKKEKLTEQEFRLITHHTLLGYKILTQKQNFSTEIATVAVQHHERYNGSGYPMKLQGEAISQFSRIVAVADSYDAMTQVHTYKLKFLGHNAIKTVLAASKNLYDPDISRVFLSIMSIYPIGSLVQLNNGSIGLVSQSNPNLPLRPKIRVLMDEFGDKVMTPMFVDLEKDTNLFISSTIDPKTVDFKIEEVL